MAEVGRLAVGEPARLPGGFWAAAGVWLERPQVANKRLCGARLEARLSVVLGGGPEPPDPPRDPGGPALAALWARVSRGLAARHPALLAFLSDPARPRPRPLQLLLRSVVPKASPRCPLAAPRRELVVQDVPGGRVTFLPLEAGNDSEVQLCSVYQLRLGREGERWFISVLLFCPEKWPSDGAICPSAAWLGGELLAKLARWSTEGKSSGIKGTLRLLPLEPYSSTYRRLKDKYRDLVKVWPEVTDPEKFVYEDVAIATYLLVLWAEERAAQGLDAKQSFVDLGCGNGLLVHILSSEGHPGRGIDVRRRKIWDLYGPQTCLEEAAITPGDDMLFPDTDWLIGNHSDELTPWIPVIAARSSYRCRFFLLPCCFFDFAGKFRRRQSQRTQYREYLDFVREVGTTCGFHVDEDSLRIPSTKRVCLVGRARTYAAPEEGAVDRQRTLLIRSRGCPAGPAGPALPPDAAGDGPDPAGCGRGRWLSGFQPREKVERVRNGAALPRELTDRVVQQVAGLLLAQRLDTGEPEAWNPGGSLSLADVARELERDTLTKLRRECGGLQTLLRNRPQVFAVHGGHVRLRDWREELLREEEEEEEEEGRDPGGPRRRRPPARKTRPCWFFSHHPDGCPLPAPRCPFAHGHAELRPREPRGRP